MTPELVVSGKDTQVVEDEERGRWFGYVDAFVAVSVILPFVEFG